MRRHSGETYEMAISGHPPTSSHDGWTTILGEGIREDWAAEGGDDHKPRTSPDRLGQGT
jgi:hypothetical protein